MAYMLTAKSIDRKSFLKYTQQKSSAHLGFRVNSVSTRDGCN